MAALDSTITATSATSTYSDASTTGTRKQAEVGSQDYFLKLLVAQMNNQDPLNPLDSAQMTSQLAQLNTVQGINKMSSQLDALLGELGASQSLQASSLVGHMVMVPSTALTLADGKAIGGVELAGPVDTLTVTVKDASGTVIHTADLGKQEAGIVDFAWDGSTDSGAAATAGTYTFAVDAKAGSSKVVANTLAAGVVANATPGAGGGSVYVAGIGNVNVSLLKQIY